MEKRLPIIKKSIKSFILGEEAKIIDKSVTKIAITSSFLAINLVGNFDDANAQGHKNHTNHNNYIGREDDSPLESETAGGVDGITQSDNLGNDDNETKNVPMAAAGKSFNIEVLGKSVKSVHGNHYNHSDNGSS
ncbi:MAG: hypothetical protein KC589_08470 [Nanoarchaeota archaeon]|nr:hypothetical protein [Nanoarchaeota archaeon]